MTIDKDLREESPVFSAVEDILFSAKASYNYKTGRTAINGKERNFSEVLDYLTVKTDKKGYKAGLLRSALSLWWNEQPEKYIASKRSLLLQYDPKLAPLTQQWSDLACREGTELNGAVLGHWIWCVKRKLAGLRVQEAMCPVFQGMSRSGKTTELLRLCEPLGGLKAITTTDQLCDPRNWQLLHDHYVIVLDEMANMKPANAETLKLVITGQDLKQRVMATTTHVSVSVNASFIGTCNPPLRDVIHDTTSGARFWEIRAHDRLPWDDLGKIDPLLLWHSVDHKAESPLMPVRDQIQRLQHDKLRTKSLLEMFLEDAGCSSGQLVVPSADFHSAYRNWCLENGEQLVGARKFTAEARKLGLVRVRQAAGWCWYLSREFTSEQPAFKKLRRVQ